MVAGAREIQQKGLAFLLRAVRTHAEGDADDAMRSLLRRHGDRWSPRSASGLLSTVPPAQPIGPDAPAAVGEAETRAEAVARYVRRLVFDGRLRPGQRLPQDEIARRRGEPHPRPRGHHRARA